MPECLPSVLGRRSLHRGGVFLVHADRTLNTIAPRGLSWPRFITPPGVIPGGVCGGARNRISRGPVPIEEGTGRLYMAEAPPGGSLAEGISIWGGQRAGHMSDAWHGIATARQEHCAGYAGSRSTTHSNRRVLIHRGNLTTCSLYTCGRISSWI